MQKITKGTIIKRQTKAARRKNQAINFREKIIMAISEIRVCFTFSLYNNGDILMLIEIIFD